MSEISRTDALKTDLMSALQKEVADDIATEIRAAAKRKVMEKMRQLKSARKIVRNLEAELEALYLEAADDLAAEA